MINPAVTRYQRAAAWCGVLFVGLFLVAIVLAGFVPPPSPQLSGQELLAKYQDRIGLIKLSMPIAILAAGLYLPFTALLAGHIARIEGRDGGMPLLAFASLGGGIINAMLFFLPFILWSGAFFRPDRAPELLQLVNDMAWLEVVMVFSAACVQNIALVLAGFMDKDPNPVFPRWCCFAMLWITVLFVPGCLAIFFFKGPFAWNGLIAFWIPAGALGLQFIILPYVLLRHVKLQNSMNPT